MIDPFSGGLYPAARLGKRNFNAECLSIYPLSLYTLINLLQERTAVMKVNVNQESLAHGLNIVSRAVSPRSTLPVLANVLVATDEGRLRLSATNLELGITCWIGAKIEDEGSTTVPARTFTDLVSTLAADLPVKMELNVRMMSLLLQSGASTTEIKCIDSQEFPPVPVFEPDDGLEINVADLKEMIQQVVFAASIDEARPILTGVLINIEDDTITMAAADGFRLSVRSAPLSSPASGSVKIVVPARALSELARIATDKDQTVRMFVPAGRGQVLFRLEHAELVSQLIEGTFPDYEQIIPKSSDNRAVISTSEFLKACKQAEIFAREGSHIARLEIKSGDAQSPGYINIRGQSEETGSNENNVDANIEGNPLTIAFNVRFLREALDVIHTPHVVLETSTETSPGVIRPSGGDDGQGEFTHVIMPMHLGS